MNFLSMVVMPLTASMLGIVVCYLCCKDGSLKKGTILLFFSVGWITSTTAFSHFAFNLWESRTSPLANYEQDARAIIILGGGIHGKAVEYQGAPVLSDYTLVRLNYGVFLHKKNNVPILVTGGDPANMGASEGAEMAATLNYYYDVSPKWVEAASLNTYFNAKKTAEILWEKSDKKVYLVTHSWHMPRASLIFRRSGFDVIEAPTRFSYKMNWSILDFLPSAEGAAGTALIMREMLGFIYYASCEVCHSQ